MVRSNYEMYLELKDEYEGIMMLANNLNGN